MPRPPGQEGDPYDRLRRRVLWSLPSGLYVLGTRHRGRSHLMTLNLAIQLATDPKLVGVAVEAGSQTHELLAAGGVFALSILARTDREVVRRFVKPDLELELDGTGSGTIGGVPVRPAPLSGAPLLESAAAFLDCSLRHRLDFVSHSLFVGEVLDAGFGPAGEEAEILRMEDTRMHYGG